MAASPQPALTAVPRLEFAVRDVAPLEHAAAPTLRFLLGVSCDRPVRSLLLDVQVQIAARRRSYDPASYERLFALFGPQSAWGANLRTLLWTRQTLVVPAFAEATDAELLVPCTYDLEVAASAYFDALDDGEVPLELLFSGSVFHGGADGRLQVARISWEQEAEYRLPVAVWRAAMDAHFPGAAWLRLGKDAFDRLRAYRSRNALPTWDDAIEALLEERS